MRLSYAVNAGWAMGIVVNWQDKVFVKCVEIFNDALTSTQHADHPDVRSISYALKNRPNQEGFAKVGKVYDRLPRVVRKETRESAMMIAKLRAVTGEDEGLDAPGLPGRNWAMGM